MNKQESQILKGVAILLMLFLHLFNQSHNVDLCHNLIFISGKPLVLILSRAANPVSFFLILGGYGLYKVNEKGDRNRWNRILKLFIHYWIILIIFVSIGHFIKPDKYPGSISSIFCNITGYDTSWNGEMWFLLPYVILSILALYLFKFYQRFKASWIIVGTLLIHLVASYAISRYGAKFFFSNPWVYNPLLVFHLLFAFSLGAMAARELFFEKLKYLYKNGESKKKWPQAVAYAVLLLLIFVNCIFKYNFFYSFGVICCVTIIRLPNFIRTGLIKLGNQSMNMWMIHSWFCYYLFHYFIYSFSYPIVILTVLTIISYLSSLIVNQITVPVEKLCLSKREIKEKPIL